MRVSAPVVVAGWGVRTGWGVRNGILVAVLAAFGERPAAIASSASVAVLVMIIALLVRAGARRHDGRTWPEARYGDSILFLAGGIVVAGLGLVFAWYLVFPGLPFLVAAALREPTRGSAPTRRAWPATTPV